MTEAASLLGAWAERFAAADPKGLAALHTEDAQFYGSVPELRRGPAEIEAYFQQLVGLSALRVEFVDVVTTPLGPEVVQMACKVLFHFNGQTVPGRLSQTWVRRGEAWKIAAHHASQLGG